MAGKSERNGEPKGGELRRISAAEKQRLVLELRKSGATFEEIAEQAGYASKSGAYKALETALKKTLQEPADELRQINRERLNKMLNSLWPFVLKGSPRHTEVALKIMDREAALLGLDAPKRVEDQHLVTIQSVADQLAEKTGRDASEIIARAEKLYKLASGEGE